MRTGPLYRQFGHVSGGVIRASFYIVTHWQTSGKGPIIIMSLYYVAKSANSDPCGAHKVKIRSFSLLCMEYDENGGGRGARIQLNCT